MSAFEDEHARAVAVFLARCVGALLPAGPPPLVDPAVLPEVVLARRALMGRAQQVIQARRDCTEAQAFHLMTRLSRSEQKSIFAVAADFADAEEGDWHG